MRDGRLWLQRQLQSKGERTGGKRRSEAVGTVQLDDDEAGCRLQRAGVPLFPLWAALGSTRPISRR
jgi:hypothetical protein